MKTNTLKHRFILSFVAALSGFLSLLAIEQAVAQSTVRQSIIRYDSIHHPQFARNGMVVSQRAVASEVGRQILADGGNAVDAAVGVGFALAVVLPRAGNIGGGGFMLVHLADAGKTVSIDFREVAPQAAFQGVFLNAQGDVDEEARRSSHRSAGVPGTVAGLDYALSKYGTMTLEQVMQPAIDLARDGFVYDYDLDSAIRSRMKRLTRHPYTRSLFFKPDGSRYQPGSVFKQPELAATLAKISEQGADAFYRGEIAQQIVAEMRRGDGLITLKDLADYGPVEREPITGSYAGYDIVSMPPPSSGGVHLVQILNIIENFPIQEMGAGSADSLHVLTEAMKIAYSDRSQHLGDPDFYAVPIDWLTSKDYANRISEKIDMQRARPSSEIAPGKKPKYESEDTTHYSIIDSRGNAVSTTYTLNFSFGSGISVPGAGFLLNNEMADFSAKPGVPDAFGLLGGEANSVESGKRPLSAMTPTIVLKNDKPVLVTGSPGGSRIITAVTQHVVNVLAHGMNVAEANHAARIHHQWYPDTLFYEQGINADTLSLLVKRGHNVKASGTMGSIQAIYWDGQRYQGTADPRRPGAGVASFDE
ncbi:MAG: gamma-glutamyltransferase [Gammaproteobacteria bacterium]